MRLPGDEDTPELNAAERRSLRSVVNRLLGVEAALTRLADRENNG